MYTSHSLLSSTDNWFAPQQQSSANDNYELFDEDSVLLDDYDSIESLLFPETSSTSLPLTSLNISQNALLPHTAAKAEQPLNELILPASQFTHYWTGSQMQEPKFVSLPLQESCHQHHEYKAFTASLLQQQAASVVREDRMCMPAYPSLQTSTEFGLSRLVKRESTEQPGHQPDAAAQQQPPQFVAFNPLMTPAAVVPSPQNDASAPSSPQEPSKMDSKGNGKNAQYTFLDITPYMTMPQAEAARQLNIPVSTLSKRWRVATGKRKWPFRVVSKLDKEITTLLHNCQTNTGNPDKDKEMEERLAYLLAKREKELRPVRIRVTNVNKSS